jgi:hypothetical protein
MDAALYAGMVDVVDAFYIIEDCLSNGFAFIFSLRLCGKRRGHKQYGDEQQFSHGIHS